MKISNAFSIITSPLALLLDKGTAFGRSVRSSFTSSWLGAYWCNTNTNNIGIPINGRALICLEKLGPKMPTMACYKN